mmetsp:Transcript_69677/g.220639  ORF Transcript_69677/g.220639 Transcript_69677/m.220639 type:complete len:277 (-) Transcript_69677:401-1231(-)
MQIGSEAGSCTSPIQRIAGQPPGSRQDTAAVRSCGLAFGYSSVGRVGRGPAMPANGDKKGKKRLAEDLYLTEWSQEEQAKLEQAMTKYNVDKCSDSVQRYILISQSLPNKSVRDVALRCCWMKERDRAREGRREVAMSKKTRTPRNRDPDNPSIFSTGHMPMGGMHGGMMGGMHGGPMMMPFHPGQAMHPGMQRALMLEDHGRDGVGSLPGMPQHMLEQNVGLIHTVRQNMSGCRIQENTELLGAFHRNLLNLIAGLPKMGRMAQMPPLPVKVSRE